MARALRKPVWLTVAPMTWSPGSFLTGMDSPVAIDSLISRGPFHDLAVSGDLLTGSDDHDVARYQFVDGYLHFLVIPYDLRGLAPSSRVF